MGESGSGKTATIMSILRLLPPSARTLEGSVELEGQQLLTLSDEEMRRLRGRRVSLVPQNPLSALNPVLTVGWQLFEAIKAHDDGLGSTNARERIIEALRSTGIATPEQQLDRYPHEFSGGMRQRILIAMAILNDPALLLADEPTTALDTTTQAQILEVIKRLITERDMGLLLITHDMGVVANVADRVAVMHTGEIVETGSVTDVFDDPLHPYTRMLLASSPGWRRAKLGLASHRVLRSQPPTPGECPYRPRCPDAVDACAIHPALTVVGHRGGWRRVRCWVAQAEARVGDVPEGQP